MKTLLEKKKMLVTNIFLFSHNGFCPIKEVKLSFTNTEFVICLYFQFERVKFFVRERVTMTNIL